MQGKIIIKQEFGQDDPKVSPFYLFPSEAKLIQTRWTSAKAFFNMKKYQRVALVSVDLKEGISTVVECHEHPSAPILEINLAAKKSPTVPVSW